MIVVPKLLLPKSEKKLSVLVAGGTGFIGTRLVNQLLARGDTVTVLSRSEDSASLFHGAVRIETDTDAIPEDTVFDIIINLAGQSIVGEKWTDSVKSQLLKSRVRTTQKLVELIERLKRRPDCFISGSAVGIYGSNTLEQMDEASSITRDNGFAQQICLAWEAEGVKAEAYGVRTVLLRIGVVLDPAGSSLAQLLPIFKRGLGGPTGNGNHWMSWITRDDLIRLIYHAAVTADISGPLNGVSPHPIQNKGFAKSLGRALGRPTFLSTPGFVLKAVMGREMVQEILLASQKISPTKALESGFMFHSPDIDTAFDGMFERSS